MRLYNSALARLKIAPFPHTVTWRQGLRKPQTGKKRKQATAGTSETGEGMPESRLVLETIHSSARAVEIGMRVFAQLQGVALPTEHVAPADAAAEEAEHETN